MNTIIKQSRSNTSNGFSIRGYLTAGIIPAVLFLLLKGLYALSLGKCTPTLLPVRILPFLILSSISFYYLLQHSTILPAIQPWMKHLFAACYSFCGYGVLQENTIAPLLLYGLFPILFVCYESMIQGRKYIPFAIACSIMLCIDPETGIEISLLLLVFSFILLIYQHKFNLGEFLHTLLVFVLAYGLSAARTMFYLIPYIAEHGNYAYDGFSLSLHPAILLGRFLPGAAASRTMTGITERMDLYFGLLPLLFFFLFFFKKEISLRKKVTAGIFTGTILCMLEFSPVLYVFNLFHITYHSTLSASFFLIFWMLYLGAYGCASFSSVREILCAALMTSIPIVISYLWGKHNFSSYTWGIMMILFLFYLIVLISHRVLKQLLYPILFTATVLELFFSAYVCTDQSLLPKHISQNANFVSPLKHSEKNVSSKSTTNKTKHSSNTLSDKYTHFVDSYQDKETEDVLNEILSQYPLSDKEKNKYYTTPFPNIFEQANAICQKLDITGTLFTPCSYTLHFSDTDQYQIESEGHHIYNIASRNGKSYTTHLIPDNYIIPYTISMSKKTTGSVYLFDNSSRNLLAPGSKQLSGKADAFIKISTSQDISVNVQILLYERNDAVFKKLCNYINTQPEETEAVPASYLTYDHLGIAVSFVFLMILVILVLYDGKEQLYETLYAKKHYLCHLQSIQKINALLRKNIIYILSFLLPSLLFITVMVVNNAQPFGNLSIFDSDGTWSSVPTFLDHYYKYQSGNRFLSMNIGYGSDLSLSYTAHLLSKVYHLLPLKMFIPFLELFIAVFMGFCGLTMSFYLTHRQTQSSAEKQDFRLLVPVCAYSISAYALAIHCYPTWYIILALFPLIIWSMDRMILTGKWTVYSFLLGTAILLELQLAMFICIYLVIRFFTYNFNNLRDFLRKGIRFTYASLLAAGCGFLTIFRTLTAYQGSGYTIEDSAFPSLGFHGSFWVQWRKLLIFTPTDAVSANDGNVSLYCGILTLVCAATALFYHRTSMSRKLKQFIPLLILLISFNGQVLSYLWNGLHYQSNCPNRYVFLLIFLLAELSYDGLLCIPYLKNRQFQRIILGLFLFFILCFSLADEKLPVALLCSLSLLIAAYLLFACYLPVGIISTKKFYFFFVLLSIGEISGNMIYAGTTWNTSSITSLGDYKNINTTLHSSTMSKQDDYFRIAFLGNFTTNYGQYYNIGCLDSFGSCLNLEQLHLHNNYAFLQTSNAMLTDYSSTQFNMSLSSCKYLFLSSTTVHSVLDLEQYDYLGYWEGYYVFRNPYYTSLGTYLPGSVVDAKLNQDINPKYYNQAMSLYLNTTENIYDFDVLTYNTNSNAQNSFYYTDTAGHILSRREAQKIIDNLSQGTYYSSRIKVHINYTAPSDGSYYLYTSSLSSLGSLHQGNNHLTIGLPSQVLLSNTRVNILLYHNNTAQKALAKIRSQQMENITIQNDTITGTTHYDEDGYTIFSLGYSKNWHAYIDGKEVKTLNPYNTNLMIPTPAGKHTVTLKFIPQYLRECQIVTLCFWIFVLLLAAGQTIKKRTLH